MSTRDPSGGIQLAFPRGSVPAAAHVVLYGLLFDLVLYLFSEGCKKVDVRRLELIRAMVESRIDKIPD